MIKNTDIFSIGKLYKPHGISGEISFAFTSDVFDRTKSPYWVLEMDGIFVPFFVESYRFRSDETALVRLVGIDKESQAKELYNKEVFYPVKFADEEEEEDVPGSDEWAFYIGFKVFDESAGFLGEIEEIDDSTLNVLLRILKDDQEFLIPAADEFFTDIDLEKREMYVRLPEGLLEL